MWLLNYITIFVKGISQRMKHYDSKLSTIKKEVNIRPYCEEKDKIFPKLSNEYEEENKAIDERINALDKISNDDLYVYITRII